MKKKDLQHLYKLKTFRYVVAGISLLLAINGCEPVYFEAEESLLLYTKSQRTEKLPGRLESITTCYKTLLSVTGLNFSSLNTKMKAVFSKL
jgi:hypothetical protein